MTWQTNLGLNMDVDVVILRSLLVQVTSSSSCSTSRVLLHTMLHQIAVVIENEELHIVDLTPKDSREFVDPVDVYQ